MKIKLPPNFMGKDCETAYDTVQKRTEEIVELPSKKTKPLSPKQPYLSLVPMKGIAISFQTQKDYDNIIQIFECGNWYDGGHDTPDPPTEYNFWKEHREKTAVTGGLYYPENSFSDKGEFQYLIIKSKFPIKQFWPSYLDSLISKIISPSAFFHIQKITPEKIEEINRWFEIYRPDRKSKG